MDEIAFLEQCIRIDSPSYHETAIATFLVEQMQGLGFEAFVDEAGNAVGMVGSHGPLIALLGHIDTVPGKVPVRIEDGLLYGRGSVDAKGPFATFICATARAHQQGTLNCRIVLIGAVEEEVASSKGAHFVVDKYAPDYCIIGEPSEWDRVTLGYKGRLLAHLRREQPGTHSAGAEHGAPEHIIDFWNAVTCHCNALNLEQPRLFDQLIPSLRTITSGTQDGLYDWAEATIGFRLPESVHPNDLIATLQSLIPANQGDGHMELTFEGVCPAFRSTRTTPLARAFVRSIQGEGGKAAFLHKTGTSDMNVAGPAWKCPIVAYGPGDSQLDHTPNEHVSIEHYQKAIGVLTAVLTYLSDQYSQ